MSKHLAQYHQPPPIQLQPLISYPEQAQPGKTYLLSIDVRSQAELIEWPYPEEEYEISFLLDLHPYFSYQPLTESDPTIILHRFGGTYGPAEFLLTANTREVQKGEIHITFLNAAGLPMANFELPCEIKHGANAHAEPKQINVPLPQTGHIPIPRPFPEETRDVYIAQIEQQLEQVGWTIVEYKQFEDEIERLRRRGHHRPLHPSFAAVKSVPDYPNDYALVIKDELVGFVKTQHPNESLDTGAKSVASSAFTRALKIPCRHSWIPFVYDATGSITQFTNKLEINPFCREIYTFHQPETLQRWLDSVPDMFATTNNLFRSRIQNMPPLNQGTLRSYQFEALRQIELALKNRQQRILIQMGTGTGKTYTLIHSIYRLLTYGGAKRILYLVDGLVAMGYAIDAFQNIKFNKSDSEYISEDAVSFTDLYNVQLSENGELDSKAQVTVAMLGDIYYSLTRRYLFRNAHDQNDEDTSLPVKYNKDLPIEYFDAIFIVDSEYTYQNRWKSLLLYFDTPIIGTADNPTQEVQEFFQQGFLPPIRRDSIQTRQQLSATIKSVRDLLRQDAGISGDTERLSQLTWLLFLKYLDDFEIAQEEIYRNNYVPIIEKPYRWRDWATNEHSTARSIGDDLLRFVNNELTPYLQTLSGESNRDMRTIVGTIFKGTVNRMRSGYILRDVVNKLDTINFNSSDDIHILSQFYETMLKEMRDAAGAAGEFYTPRPIVRFIIDRLNPQLGEKILDPACGTARFLVEAYEKLKDEVYSPAQQVQLFDNIIGIEKKSMAYLLGIMNMLLHGIERPNLTEHNSLAINLREVKDEERVDIIATNPPFGGEEERGIIDNFPIGMRSSETALLFVQSVMEYLKRPGGRCGVVLPNGFLFRNGVASTIKEKLLKQFNLHTILRLPAGVFAPYTSIPSNILFFEATTPLNDSSETICTKEVWYYQIPLPEGRNSYTKTKPIQFEEFQDCIDWWESRVENEHAWKVSAEDLLANGCNLDIKNPHDQPAIRDMTSVKLLETTIDSDQHNLSITKSIRDLVKKENLNLIETSFKQTPEENLLSLVSTYCLNVLQRTGCPEHDLEHIYSRANIGFTGSASSTDGPLFVRITDIKGGTIDWARVIRRNCPNPDQYELRPNDILIARSGTGSIGRSGLVKEVPEQVIFSSSLIRLHFTRDISPEYIYWCLQSQQFWGQIMHTTKGMYNTTIRAISHLQFPVPYGKTQNTIATYLNDFRDLVQREGYSNDDLQTFLQRMDNFISRSAEN